MKELSELESALEAVLFAFGTPLSNQRLSDVLEVTEQEVEVAAQNLADGYRFARSGIRILHLEDSWQMVSASECSGWIRRAAEKKRPDKLSSAALEVLSVVAYYQPVTRAYIDQVRGVDSSHSLGLLQDRELVEPCGNLEVPGRPVIYRTTMGFLRAFGMRSLEELPELPVEEGEPSEGQGEQQD